MYYNRNDERVIMNAIKEDLIKTIKDMPDDCTYDDVMHALYIKAKFEHGISEVKQGKGLSHEVAKNKLNKWQK